MVELAVDKKVSTPFPAVVGQQQLKRALLAAAVHDDLDGVLAVGERGTAKSTLVRGLADLLPHQEVAAGCPYGCHPDDPSPFCSHCREADRIERDSRRTPVVTLPLGATRDRVVGTMSVADALEGEASFEPGLLASANRGILYVDEINLLDDHLVDTLLDAAASGVNHVERDGVSETHPAEFTLVGSMNPEEGELRPQLRDRFALQPEVTGCRDVDERVEIMDRALEADCTEALGTRYEEEVERLRDDILEARSLDVDLPEGFRRKIAETCLDAGVEGHRADLATARASEAFAALEGRTKVVETDVREAAELALAHRSRGSPFEDGVDAEDAIDEHLGEEDGSEAEDGSSGEADGEGGDGAGDVGCRDEDSGGDDEIESDARNPRVDDDTLSGDEGSPSPEPRDIDGSPGEGSADGDEMAGGEAGGGEGFPENPVVPGCSMEPGGQAVAPEVGDLRSAELGGSGRADACGVEVDGPQVRSMSAEDGDVDVAATVRAAARRGSGELESRDLRSTVREGEAGSLTVFSVDASASMAPAMRRAKAVVLELLRDSYVERDEVSFVSFGGDDAEVLLPPTSSVGMASRHLKELPNEGRTPLPAGLRRAAEVVERHDTEASLVVVVTDGRSNAGGGSPTESTREAARSLESTGAEVLVVDASDGRGGLVDIVVEETRGRRLSLDELSSGSVESALDRRGVEDR